MTSDKHLDDAFHNKSHNFRRSLEAESDKHPDLTLEEKTILRNNKTGTQVSFRFDPETRCIWYRDKHGEARLELRKSEDGTVEFIDTRTEKALPAEDPAKEFATRLLAPSETTKA